MTTRYAVVFAPRAERQLADLYAYIAARAGEVRAETYIGRIVADCLSLSTFPERGNRRDDIRPNLRIRHHARKVTIAFSIDMTTALVTIQGTFYGGQDFESVLRAAALDD